MRLSGEPPGIVSVGLTVRPLRPDRRKPFRLRTFGIAENVATTNQSRGIT